MTPAIFRIVLDTAGYTHVTPATEEEVRKMFMDYVDSGYFSNIFPEDADDISMQEICQWFLQEDRRDRRRKTKESGEKRVCTFSHFLASPDDCSTAPNLTLMLENTRI
jgi:hypothetical protein